jgi:hypothetical protein
MPREVKECEERSPMKHIIKAAVILGLGLACYGFVLPTPAGKKDALGTWIGATPYLNDVYRIVLNENGGLVGYQFVGHEPALYRIDSWEVGPKAQLKTVITRISTNGDPITIEGHVEPSRIELVIKSPGTAWRQNVTAHREEAIENRIKVLRNSMVTLLQDKTTTR